MASTFSHLLSKQPRQESDARDPVCTALKGTATNSRSLAPLQQVLGHAVVCRIYAATAKVSRRRGVTRRETNASTSWTPETRQKRLSRNGSRRGSGEAVPDASEQRRGVEHRSAVRRGRRDGAAVALNWAAQDWNYPQLLGAKGRQGQDVKALVLISPERNFKGLPITKAQDDVHIRTQLSIMIIAGKGKAKELEAASAIHTKFKRFHPEDEDDKKDLYLITPSTSLQGQVAQRKEPGHSQGNRQVHSAAACAEQEDARVGAAEEPAGVNRRRNAAQGPALKTNGHGGHRCPPWPLSLTHLGVSQTCYDRPVGDDHPGRRNIPGGIGTKCGIVAGPLPRTNRTVTPAHPISVGLIADLQHFANRQQVGAGEHLAILLVDLQVPAGTAQVTLREFRERVAVGDRVTMGRRRSGACWLSAGSSSITIGESSSPSSSRPRNCCGWITRW